MQEIKIKVKGMECEGCEKRIKNALSEIDGVEKVDADYKTGMVVVKSNEQVGKDVLEEKINNLGFEV